MYVTVHIVAKLQASFDLSLRSRTQFDAMCARQTVAKQLQLSDTRPLSGGLVASKNEKLSTAVHLGVAEKSLLRKSVHRNLNARIVRKKKRKIIPAHLFFLAFKLAHGVLTSSTDY